MAMFHSGRCGSTLLADVLRQHSQVRWSGEIFDGVRSYCPGFEPTRPWVEEVIRRSVCAASSGVMGFETKAMHFSSRCVPQTPQEYVQLLQKLGCTHYILLTRRNALRALVSGLFVYHQGRKELSHDGALELPRSVKVDIEAPSGPGNGDLLFVLRWYLEFQRNMIEALPQSQLLQLVFENDIEPGVEGAYRKVCEHVGISPERYELRMRRVNPFPLSSMIMNFGEVASYLKGTEFEWMLAG
nr:hypothetical protein [Oceanococcus sp. HetDA_MAG_MS8]